MEKNQPLFFHQHKRSCKIITVRIMAQDLHETLLIDIVGEWSYHFVNAAYTLYP